MADRIASDLERVGRGAHVARGGRVIHEHGVDVAGLQRRHRRTEGVEQLDALARVLVVGAGHIERGIEVGRAGLRADEEIAGAERLGVGEARLVGAHEQVLLRQHVGIGEVDLLLAIVGDADAIHADVVETLLHALDHRVPARQLPLDLEVEPLRDLVDGIVFPADALPGLGVGKVERRIGVLGHRDHGPPVEVGQ